ncbi:MAG: TIGR03560 family F420-dependent LLM class oxidoreductase [Actinobacteria bacterium]|nr:TIGR03560 family F420-dependent LLM class oxidoreductase [Actinomycetota bacterium]
MEVCLMIEGQEDVSWEDWMALGAACDEHGLAGLFRSDHYLSVRGNRTLGSLDAWTTLAGVAARTERIRLGTLVSPVTFRHPSDLAKSVVTVDHISEGRAELGIGAGWHELEHRAYGFPFPDPRTRVDMLAEQLEIVHRSWHEGTFSFTGAHYRTEDLDALPKPVQRPHPPVIVGGAAGPRSARLAARWADEYNLVSAAPSTCAEKRPALAGAWEAEGRDPATLRLSVMTGAIVGADDGEVRERARRLLERTGRGGDPEEFIRQEHAWVIGTVDQAAERLREYEEAGVARVMLQHLVHDDLEMVALLGRELVPAVA